jgi:WhiB family redox-sensing transcriptional regulator
MTTTTKTATTGITLTAMEDAPAPGPWAKRAACLGLPTDSFFPDDPADADLARAVCQRCPVRADCAAYALAIPALAGVWGGLTEGDRRRIRRCHRRGRHHQDDQVGEATTVTHPPRASRRSCRSSVDCQPQLPRPGQEVPNGGQQGS